MLTPPVVDHHSDRAAPPSGSLRHTGGPFRDLAPSIHRQRLVVEGLVTAPIVEHEIVSYLKQLGSLTDMTVLAEPVTNRSPLYGWAAWVHWETSGAHFYAWDAPHLFFSVDMYTCKQFDPSSVIDFTQEYFRATEIQSHGF